MKTLRQQIFSWDQSVINLFLVILGVFAVFLFTGCHTVKSDTTKVAKVDYRHPLVLAGYCASKYPPTDSVSILKEYIQGEDVVMLDTATEYLTEVNSDTVTLIKWLTKTVTKVDTFRDTRYVQQENKALIVLRDAELKVCNADLVKSESERKSWRNQALCLYGFLIVLAIVLYFKSKLNK